MVADYGGMLLEPVEVT